MEIAIREVLGDDDFQLPSKMYQCATRHIERVYVTLGCKGGGGGGGEEEGAAEVDGEEDTFVRWSSVIPDDPNRNVLALALRFHIADSVTHVCGDGSGDPPDYLLVPYWTDYWLRLYQFASDMAAMQMIDLNTRHHH